MTTVIQSLLAIVPPITEGVPLGMSEFPGYRFYVQVAIPSPGGTLPFVLPGVLGGLHWQDATQDLQGIQWKRGGAPNQRPIAGELTMRLFNTMCQWCPWVTTYYGPGTLIRVVVSNGVTMHHEFVGITQSWNEASVGLIAYEWVDVTAWEPLFLWNDVDENALVTSVGDGETLTARINRLATKVDWQFSLDVSSSAPATFQATDLSQDMATELYLTVDSIDAVVWPGKDGTLTVRDRSVGTGVSWDIPSDSLDPDSLVLANDDDRILAQVALARVGGGEVVYPNVGIALRYFKRSTKRDGLITIAEAADADLQRVATGVLGRSTQTYRPLSTAIQSSQNTLAQNIMVLGDITDRVTLHRLVAGGSRLIFYAYAICGIEIGVQVSSAGTHWSGKLLFDIEVGSHWTKFKPIWRWGVHFWGSTTEGWGP